MKDRHKREANRRYHDHVAARYDDIYSGPRWDLLYALSWEALKPFLPSDLRAPIVDLGCGTGWFGLRLAKSGYTVTLVDLSPEMLEAARRRALEAGLEERVTFMQADVMDLQALPQAHFALALAQGDVLSFAAHPPRALREVRRLLRPGGVLYASVDQTYAALAHYAEKGALDDLEKLVHTGEMTWLARAQEERFPVHSFTAEGLRALLEKTGFEVLDLFGKTVLPMKQLEPLLGDPAKAERLLALEKKLRHRPSALGLASHIQFTARVP